MRISDWSSDVCSSDLVDSVVGAVLQAVTVLVAAWLLALPLATASQPAVAAAINGSKVLADVNAVAPEWLRKVPNELDRKSVVEGKSVSVRVEFGGRRIIKKKTTREYISIITT